MGSVLAASSPNPSPPASGGAAAPGLTVPPGFGMPPVSSVLSPSEAASGQQQEAENSLPNPGAFDECHRKCKGKYRLLRKAQGVTILLLINYALRLSYLVLLSYLSYHLSASACVSLLRGFPYADGRRQASCQQGT